MGVSVIITVFVGIVEVPKTGSVSKIVVVPGLNPDVKLLAVLGTTVITTVGGWLPFCDTVRVPLVSPVVNEDTVNKVITTVGGMLPFCKIVEVPS